MAHTNVLLREDIDDLGARGEIVKVKAGYARNYLLPRRLAFRPLPATSTRSNRSAPRFKKRAKEKGTAEEQAEKMKSLRLIFTRKVGDQASSMAL